MAESNDQEVAYLNADPIYTDYSNDVDKPINVTAEVKDWNLPLQYANGEVPAELQESEESDEQEKKDEQDKGDDKPKAAPAPSPAAAPKPAASDK
ncbi:gp014 [Rhodococcus phage ReqiDocB7]|uniref:gp014 n=1 Tax=Rhodococcus phage ReqiDocB7 TaxID=691966 RepID=UPI0001CDD750|nr:gp014 [Rhodococcus phage ReqiDocB7]ADD80800.1 gp014 [Rhodococcus phage ReqiDocB7]